MWGKAGTWLVERFANIRVILAVIGIVLGLIGCLIWQIYSAGEKHCQQQQAVAVIAHDTKSKHAYDKIDRNTPYGADELTFYNWLRQSAGRP